MSSWPGFTEYEWEDIRRYIGSMGFLLYMVDKRKLNIRPDLRRFAEDVFDKGIVRANLYHYNDALNAVLDYLENFVQPQLKLIPSKWIIWNRFKEKTC